ncbi:uncharacterized protein [Drosophila tropicalis]|uniref:uncharacterized protein n=1 Tax=Drosophila tropicalis TaxID=46794 RepID=UPI0035ABF4AF
MSVDLQSLLNLMWFAVCLAEAQLFEQPLTNSVYTTHIQRGLAGRNGQTAVDIQRAPIQIIEPAQLHQQLKQITGSETLAPLLYNLLGQTVPNWQTPTNQPQRPQQQQFQQPQQQQHRQHFFVYESPQPVRLVSQQPQILPGFNGVNVHLQQQQQQQQPLSLPKPIQAQQQYPQTEPKIVKAPPATVPCRRQTLNILPMPPQKALNCWPHPK